MITSLVRIKWLQAHQLLPRTWRNIPDDRTSQTSCATSSQVCLPSRDIRPGTSKLYSCDGWIFFLVCKCNRCAVKQQHRKMFFTLQMHNSDPSLVANESKQKDTSSLSLQTDKKFPTLMEYDVDGKTAVDAEQFCNLQHPCASDWSLCNSDLIRASVNA